MTTKFTAGEDFLEVDRPIPGQNFACMTFISPENVLKNKDLFKVHEFLKHINTTHNLSIENITSEYDEYIYKNGALLNKEFDSKNEFQTSIRGIKIRGVYDTLREAQIRAKVLQKMDKNFHVYVGQVGYWLPWDPTVDAIENQEYAEDQLNTLVKGYADNQQHKNVIFDEDTKKRIKVAQEEGKTLNKLESDPWMENKAAADSTQDSAAADKLNILVKDFVDAQINKNASQQQQIVNQLELAPLIQESEIISAEDVFESEPAK